MNKLRGVITQATALVGDNCKLEISTANGNLTAILTNSFSRLDFNFDNEANEIIARYYFHFNYMATVKKIVVDLLELKDSQLDELLQHSCSIEEDADLFSIKLNKCKSAYLRLEKKTGNCIAHLRLSEDEYIKLMEEREARLNEEFKLHAV